MAEKEDSEGNLLEINPGTTEVFERTQDPRDTKPKVRELQTCCGLS